MCWCSITVFIFWRIFSIGSRGEGLEKGVIPDFYELLRQEAMLLIAWC